MKTYDTYKDSGIDWLGEIPEHWEVESFKNILVERNEKNIPIKSEERLSLSIEMGVTLYSEKTTNLDRFKDDFTQYKLAYKDDLVFNSMNMIVGAVGVSKYFGCVSPVYYTYYSKKNNFTSKFYEFLFRSRLVQGVLYSMGKGLIAIDRGEGKYNTLRLKVSREDLRSMKLPFPTYEEQYAIVSFLDDKCGKIDEAVRIKEQQIVLLKEHCQITIHNAITKGVPCHAEPAEAFPKLKNSGIDWIGDIPEHWEVKRLASLGRFSKGGGFSKSDLVEENGVAAILYGDIYTKYNHKIKTPVRLISLNVAKQAIKLNIDDLLFTGSGETKEDIGKCVVFKANIETVAGGDVIIFKQKNDNSSYLSYSLNTNGVKFEKAKSSKGEIIVHTYASKLREIFTPIPPISEQEAIVTYLDAQTTKIDQAITQKTEQITKLKEYKQSLINEVVTGKVRVS